MICFNTGRGSWGERETEQNHGTGIQENQRQVCCVYRGSLPRRKFNSMPGTDFPLI